MAVRIRQLSNLDVDPLTGAKNKYVMRYNGTSGKFDLIPFDIALEVSASDGDISDSFVDQLEEEIEVGEVQNFTYDGGSF